MLRWVVPGVILSAIQIIVGSNCAIAATTTELKIVPGPIVMSKDEKAISIDASKGIEQGVVLVDELDRNEEVGKSRVTHHFRAKILSTEGAKLAEIEIPCDVVHEAIHDWWGRTILPDGTVLELKRKDLKEELVANSGSAKTVKHLKGTLPGVVPGCVVDYGWSYGYSGIYLEHHIALQRAWPIRKLAYRWEAFRGRASASRVSNGDGIGIKVAKEPRVLLVTGSDIPAFHTEPWMPPISEVQPEVICYYPDQTLNLGTFWDDFAHRIDTEASEASAPDSETIKKTITSMRIPPDANLETKLQTAYTWVLDNIENMSLRSSEQVEAAAAVDEKTRKKDQLLGMTDVIEKRRSGSLYIDYLFLAIARAFGADAFMVQAPDRTHNYWDQGRKDADQIPNRFVGVATPGTDYAQFKVVSPGDKLSYGEVPWWCTGTNALMATTKGATPITIPASPARDNTAQSRAVLKFTEDNSAVDVRWTRTAKGQTWYLDRRSLWTSAPDARKKRLDDLCGAKDSFEVSKAEAQGLGDPRAPFVLTCEGQIPDSRFTAGSVSYDIGFEGAWMEAIPELKGALRTYPVIFNLAHADLADIEVNAPYGFVSKEAPQKILLDERFGSYQLVIRATDSGYTVHRAFGIGQIKIEPADYPELRKFLNDAIQADKTRVVFVKKPTQ